MLRRLLEARMGKSGKRELCRSCGCLPPFFKRCIRRNHHIMGLIDSRPRASATLVVRRGDDPYDFGRAIGRVGAAMDLSALEGEAIAFLQPEELAGNPEI